MVRATTGKRRNIICAENSGRLVEGLDSSLTQRKEFRHCKDQQNGSPPQKIGQFFRCQLRVQRKRHPSRLQDCEECGENLGTFQAEAELLRPAFFWTGSTACRAAARCDSSLKDTGAFSSNMAGSRFSLCLYRAVRIIPVSPSIYFLSCRSVFPREALFPFRKVQW